MKKNTKLLIVALVCAAVLAGVLVSLLLLPGETEDLGDSIDEGTSVSTSVDDEGVHQAQLELNEKGELDNNSYGTLIDYVPADISTIKIENTSGSYEIKSTTPTTTDEDGNTTTEATVYTLVGYEDFDLQTGQADSIANNAAALDFTSVASIDGANEKDFGFENPRATATITYTDKTTAVIIVGGQAPMEAGSYVKFGSGPSIYLVDDDSVSALLFSINDLISLTINDAAASDDNGTPTKVILSGTNYPKDVEFVQNKDESNSAQFVIQKPETFFADDNKTSLITGAIRGLYADSVVYANPSDKQISDCGLNKPFVHIVGEYPDETFDLIASEPDSKGNVFLMKTGGKVIYKMAGKNLPWTTLKYEDLISTYVLNPTFTAITSMTLNDGNTDYKFDLTTKTSTSTDNEGSETTTSTTTVKCGSVIVSLDNFNIFFQNVAYTERADNKAFDPSGSPVLTLTYTYSTKADTDTVSFYKSDSGKYIAVLNGRTVGTVYESRIKRIIEQVPKVAKDETVDTLS